MIRNILAYSSPLLDFIYSYPQKLTNLIMISGMNSVFHLNSLLPIYSSDITNQSTSWIQFDPHMKIYSNIILPSTLRSFAWCILFRLSNQNFICSSQFSSLWHLEDRCKVVCTILNWLKIWSTEGLFWTRWWILTTWATVRFLSWR